MHLLTHAELLELFPSCPRRDNSQYLADCAIRRLQQDPTALGKLPPPWRIEAGIGSLECLSDGQITFAPAAAEREPTTAELAQRFYAATRHWASAGMPLASEEKLRERRAACLVCPKFVAPALANGWLGKCSQCGCTGVKLYLATESCPLNNWRATA